MALHGLLAPEAAPVLAGALALGLVHGAEPGHGWPVAAAYALGRERPWAHGFAASLLLGLGHLISSLAVVGAFFLVKSALPIDRLNDPLYVLNYPIGGPVGVAAGGLLIGLGLREYRRDRGHHHHPDGTDQDPGHDHENPPRSWLDHLRSRLSAVGHDHRHPSAAALDREGLASIVWTAFLLGFVHEEEFEIIGLCLGTTYCLELMVGYALAVLVSLVGVTMLLLIGYHHYRERVEVLAAYFPIISAAVLVTIGVGFVLGLL